MSLSTLDVGCISLQATNPRAGRGMEVKLVIRDAGFDAVCDPKTYIAQTIIAKI